MVNGRSHRWILGFTYLWTLLLVAFMGIGMTVTAETYRLAAKRDRERELLWIGQQFREAIASYYNAQRTAGRGEYPATLDDLLRDRRFVYVKRHLRRIYRDPMTGNSEWGLVRISGRIAGVHSLSEQAPLKKANFEPAERAFADAEAYRDWIFTYPAELNPDLPHVASDGVASMGLEPRSDDRSAP